MRRVLMIVAVLGAASAGCKHHARKVACNDECVGLGEPIPGGAGRIVPTEVPLAPRVSSPPANYPDQRYYTPTQPPTLPPREILLPSDRPMGRSNVSETRPTPAVPKLPNTVRAEPVPSRDGLPGYTAVAGIPQVAAGRKPTTAGFETLKRDGTKTVLYIHAPRTDATAARDLAAASNLNLIPLAVSPETLGADLKTFTRVVGDPATRPLYVVDDSGIRAGSLWYLYFRTREYAGDEAARVRATPLGLPADATTEEAKTFWIAVQRALVGG